MVRDAKYRGALHSAWMNVDGLRLHARVGGLQPGRKPVVLVHGLGASSRYMIPVAAHLAEEFAVHAIDLPGHGRSDKPARAFDVPALAEALAAWMAAAGLARAAVLGNSMGCQIAAELAVRHPERVDRLLLVGPTVDPHARTVARQLGRLIIAAAAEPLSLAAIQTLDYLRMGRAVVDEVRHMMAHRIEDLLPLITAPVLVVRGSRDPIVPASWAEQAARLSCNGRLVTIPGAAHALNYSAPLELARIARPFIGPPAVSPSIQPSD